MAARSPCKAGFKLNINGSVTFLGFASASGSITITMQRDVFSIEFDISLSLGPLSIAAKGGAAIYTDSAPGLALLLDVSINANMFEVIKIKATGKLQLNTSGLARTLSGVTMQANSFRIALNGEVKFLEVLKFNAGFVLEVGYEGVGSWRVQFNARMDFFGLMTVQAFGHVQLQGLFRHLAGWRTGARHAQFWPGRPACTSGSPSANGRCWPPRA
jgi:hypothetical protein